MTATTRRAALGALASAPALAIPAVASTASPTDDAALFALRAEIEAADQRERAALKAQALAETVHYSRVPKRPSKPSEETPVLGDMERRLLEKFRLRLEEVNSRGPSPHEVAMREWEHECARVRVESGVAEAEASTDEAQEATDAIGRRIASIRATTLNGLVFKAKYALAHNKDEPDPGVVASILADLIAMSAVPGEGCMSTPARPVAQRRSA
jgi:hypothetical protein